MVAISGLDAVQRALGKLNTVQAGEDLNAALVTAGEIIEAAAGRSITTGAVSGKSHVASLPGEPPKNDSGVLARGIETVNVAPLQVEVRSTAPYAAALEYGTSRMQERPYMRPALEATRKEVVAYVQGAVSKILAGVKGQ